MLHIIALFSGVALLIIAAELTVISGLTLSKKLSIPTAIIGMLMAVATSLPELAVTIQASVRGYPDLLAGNLIGSNIINLLMILSLAVIISGVYQKSGKKQPIIMTLAMVLSSLSIAVASIQGAITWWIGSVFLALGFLYVIYESVSSNPEQSIAVPQTSSKVSSRGEHKNVDSHPVPQSALLDEEQNEEDKQPQWWSRMTGSTYQRYGSKIGLTVVILFLIGALIAVSLAAQVLVWGAVGVSDMLGVSPAISGLLVVAIGTSLPELAVVISATRLNQVSVILGLMFGSNIFNSWICLGIAALIIPIEIPTILIYNDIPYMVGASIWAAVIALGVGRGWLGGRWLGVLGMIAFVIYLAQLIGRVAMATA